MLTTKQISEIMNCGLWMARRRMENAGIKYEMKAFGHGRKAYWNITEDQVRALGIQEKPPTVTQQAAALSALEAVFGVRRPAGDRNAINR